MSLASALHTALSGMSAATVSVGAASRNLANMRTNGYKSLRPALATQSPGSTQLAAGSVRIGTGVQVVGFITDTSAGALVVPPDESEPVELSNTDVGAELVELILASEQFAVNAEVFYVADQLLDGLIYLRR